MATKKILTLSALALIALAVIAIGVVASETGYITLTKGASKTNIPITTPKPICSDADRDKSSSCEADRSKPQFNCRWSAGCDCNDNNANVRFGVQEICDRLDNNCDGLIDNACVGQDLDKDGYVRLRSVGVCNADVACAIKVQDCDDNNANVNPGINEVCDANNIGTPNMVDGIDNNCNGKIDGCDAGQVCTAEDGTTILPNGTVAHEGVYCV